MEVWTIQLGKWRLAQAQGIELLNITRGSGEDAFAPSAEALAKYKAGQIDETIYRHLYISRMRTSFTGRRAMWEQLKTKERLALACYCPAGAFCHRHIFKELLTAYLLREGVAVIDQGELQ